MQIRSLPALLRSRQASNLAVVELGGYLLVPWLVTLPWSVVQQVVLVLLLSGEGIPAYLAADDRWWTRVLLASAWYVVSFSPHLFWGLLYWRRTTHASLARGLLMAHLMVPWCYLSYLAGWRALGRMIVRRGTWAKTVRLVET